MEKNENEYTHKHLCNWWLWLCLFLYNQFNSSSTMISILYLSLKKIAIKVYSYFSASTV